MIGHNLVPFFVRLLFHLYFTTYSKPSMRSKLKLLFESMCLKDLRCLSVAVFIGNSFNSTLSCNGDVARLVTEVEADN